MARTTEEIFGNESSFRASSAPQPDWSGSSTDAPSTEESKPATDKGAMPATAKPVATKTATPATAQKAAAQVDEDEPEEAIPDSLDGLKETLKKARGDARRNRKSWQDAERKLAEFEGERRALRSMQQPQQQVAQPQEAQKKSFWEAEPEAFIDDKLTAVETAHTRRLIDSEERILRLTVTDAGEALDAFAQAAQADQGLRHAFNANGGSVEFAYRQGKALLEKRNEASLFEKYGVTSATELEAKILEQAASGGVQPPQVQPARRPVLPPKSNAGARGTGGGSTQSWSGPRSTDQVWGR